MECLMCDKKIYEERKNKLKSQIDKILQIM